MNGTGLKPISLYHRRRSWMLQLKSSLVSSALAPCIFVPQDLSRGNGTNKFNFSSIYLPSCRLMIITGTLTIITAVSFLWAPLTSHSPFLHSRIPSFLFPDSPTNAWFLTEDERAKAVRRIKVCDHSPFKCLELSVNNEGKPNWHREQAVQKGAVSTVRTTYCIVMNLWTGWLKRWLTQKHGSSRCSRPSITSRTHSPTRFKL